MKKAALFILLIVVIAIIGSCADSCGCGCGSDRRDDVPHPIFTERYEYLRD